MAFRGGMDTLHQPGSRMNFLPWIVSVLVGGAIVSMQAIGGGGRPGFLLLVCYLPLFLAGLISLGAVFWEHPHRVPGKACLASALALAGYLVARSCHGGDPGQRVFEILRITAILLVYLITALAMTARGPRALFLGILMGSAFLQALAEIYQFHVDRNWAPLGTMPGLASGGLAGTYASKNHLSWLLCDAALMALAFASSRAFRWVPRAGFLYLFLVLTYGVLISSSRGGMVGLLSGFVAFGILSMVRLASAGDGKGLAWGALGGLLLALVVAASWIALSAHPFLADAFRGLWMDSFREDLWRASIHDLGLSPFWGNGVASFQWAARIMLPWESVLAHNDYLQLLSEYGVVGGCLAAFFLVLHLAKGMSCIVHETDGSKSSLSRTILSGSLCVVMAQLVHSALDFNMHIAANALPAGFFLGILASADRFRGRGRSVRWPGIAALGACCLAIAALVIPVWNDEKTFLATAEEYRTVFLPGGPPLSDPVRRLIPLLERSPANDRYADLGAAILLAGMAGDRGEFPKDPAFATLLARLRATVEHVPNDWYLWTTLSRADGLLRHEEQNRSNYIRAMLGLPLYAYPHQEEALIMEDYGEKTLALHYYRIGLCLTDPRETSSQIRKLEGNHPQ
jgi:O-antigen ligase